MVIECDEKVKNGWLLGEEFLYNWQELNSSPKEKLDKGRGNKDGVEYNLKDFVLKYDAMSCPFMMSKYLCPRKRNFSSFDSNLFVLDVPFFKWINQIKF